MFSSLASRRTNAMTRPGTSWILILSVALFMALLITGCGGGDKDNNAAGTADDSPILATVGEGEITAYYYEDRLVKLAQNELPVEDGQYMDMSTEAGKLAFLEVLINKELMVQKALQLGYDQDVQVVGARNSMSEYEGGLALWEEVIGEVSRFISDEELADFYEKLGTDYLCHYVICNFEDDALKAREFALTGADWEDVVAQFHDGNPAPSGRYQVKIPYGQYSPEFEDVVFATELGGVSMPITSNYGFWVLRVVDIVHNEKPSLEVAKAQILDVTRNRKVGALRVKFRDEMHEKYELRINEDALWTVYTAMPDQAMMDPVTNEPLKNEDLIDMEVPTEALGEVLLSYRGGEGEQIEMTVAEYQEHFNNMSIFQRPKKGDMLGGFRNKLKDEMSRGMIAVETRERGFLEDPEVVAKVDLKVEEILVTQLYKEVVTFDDKVTSDQLEAFWVDHKDDYYMQETRSGHLVICKNREDADKAREAAMEGTVWRSILVKYGTDMENKKAGGNTGQVPLSHSSPIAEPLFGLEQHGVSQPFPVGNGKYAVVQLDAIVPAHSYELSEVSEAIGGRIRKDRQEAAFKVMLGQWTEELGVTINTENLASLKSWEELTTVVKPDNLVPRN